MNPKIYIDKEGVVKYIQDCPVEPKREDFDEYTDDYSYAMRSFNVALSNAVRFADQQNATDQCLTGRILSLKPQPDTLYDLPSGIEIEVRRGFDNCKHLPESCCSTVSACDCPKELAYIKSSPQKKEESQEELWREAFDILVNTIGFEQTMEKFTIQRKP